MNLTRITIMVRVLYSLSVVMVVGFLSSVSSAATFYVKKDGNNLDSGTSWETAYWSIQSANANMQSGDTCWVRWSSAGYTEQVTISTGGLSFYGETSGGYPKILCESSRPYGFYASSGMGPTNISGFTVLSAATSTGYGIYIYSGSIVDNIVRGSQNGIRVGSASYIAHNTVSVSSNNRSGIISSTDTGTIERNHLTGTTGNSSIGIDMGGVSSGIVRWNEVSGYTYGIKVAGYSPVYANYTHNCDYGIYANTATKSVRMFNNLVAKNKSGFYILNPPTGSFYHHIYNNLVLWNSLTAFDGGNTNILVGWNCVTGSASISWSHLSYLGGNIALDPGFVDFTGGNYRVWNAGAVINGGDWTRTSDGIDWSEEPFSNHGDGKTAIGIYNTAGAFTPTPPTPTPSSSPTPSPSPTATPVSPTPSPSPSSSPTSTPSPEPSATPSSSPSPTPSPLGTLIPPSPSPTPSCGPSIVPERAVIQSGDYNGDGADDIGIFRPSAGLWSIRNITRLNFGGASDQPGPGDYDGDGTADIAIYRASTGLWSISGVTRAYFGGAEDRAAPADYNGDGSCDIGIFRENGGMWSIRSFTRFYFGATGDWAIPGDYDNNGTAEAGLYRVSSGQWMIQNTTRFYFGGATDWPVTGDYFGSSEKIFAIYRPCSGQWALKDLTRIYFGNCFDYPRPGDFNGDGTYDFGIFRDSAGMWSVRNLTRVYFGATGDFPVTR